MSAPDVEKALALAHDYAGSCDSASHKDWLIDQMVRALTGDGYEAWVTEYRNGDDGPETYDAWEVGIPP
jgi:hypothetical protein